jgi:hypothetical protein
MNLLNIIININLVQSGKHITLSKKMGALRGAVGEPRHHFYPLTWK